MPNDALTAVEDCLAELSILRDIAARTTPETLRNDPVARRAAAYAVMVFAAALREIPDDWLDDLELEPWDGIVALGDRIRDGELRLDGAALWQVIAAGAEPSHAALQTLRARQAATDTAIEATPTGSTPVNWQDLMDAHEFVSFGAPGEHEAFVSRVTGEVFWRSELNDDLDELPEDLDEGPYVEIPHKKELDLGKRLIFRFVEQVLPGELHEVERIFSRKGAYARFKDLLQRKRALDRWHAFEAEATERALREWCEDEGLAIDDSPRDVSEGATH